MLQELIIDHLVLIQHAEVSFEPGMTCLTGETGAGKSILLDALGLAIGQKAEAGLIKRPATQGQITATFHLQQHSKALSWLVDNQLLKTPDQPSCHLRRTIDLEGRSKAFINGLSVPIHQLKALGQHLVYIHGQHQHLKLLKPEIQLDVLDGYGQLLNLRAKLNHLWLRHQANQTALQAALENQQRQTARRELLAFQIQELTEAQLKVGENEALTQEFDWLSHQTDYQQQIVSITEVLYDDEGIEKILASQSKILAHLATQSQKPELHNAKTLIESADIQLKEARCDLTTLLEQFEMDPERFNTIEVRLGQLYELGRKYKVPPQDLPQLLNDLNQEYQTLTHQDDLLTVLQAENLEIETAYQQAAAHLSSERKHAAHTLCAALNSLLPELRLPDCQIQIQLTPRNPRGPSPTGNESVLFLIRTHAHLDFHPMNQGISGGELSRIALAVHVVCSTVEGTPSLIFDEVDVGIGGGTAEIVGRLLRRMGHHTQVLCITHLAQVAAQAQHHLCVQKTQLKDQLYTAVIPLQGEARIQELARMIGGVEITQQTLLHATELYALAQKQ